MNITRMVCTSTLAAGIGAAALFGPGMGIDHGRRDHQPFTYNGQHVTPMPAGNGAGWGFWFLGQWIGL